ncbi:MAG: hypothetical protein R2932_10395 [Caldilineaceae bacterium]
MAPVLASGGKSIDVAHAINFLREDLHNNQLIGLLFCFDEVDLLHTSKEEPRRNAHIQLLEFLDSLRGLAGLLFMGQRALLDTDHHYLLHGLDATESAQLLHNLKSTWIRVSFYVSMSTQQAIHGCLNFMPPLSLLGKI